VAVKRRHALKVQLARPKANGKPPSRPLKSYSSDIVQVDPEA
jgi:hypothetical protein